MHVVQPQAFGAICPTAVQGDFRIVRDHKRDLGRSSRVIITSRANLLSFQLEGRAYCRLT